MFTRSHHPWTILALASLAGLACSHSGATGSGATEGSAGTGAAGGSAGSGATGGSTGSSGTGGSSPAQVVIPSDRVIDWSHAGVVQPDGTPGIPSVTTVCATLDAAKYGDGTTDASAAIQAAIKACPDNQVVYLPAGTYKLGSSVTVDHSVVLRGAGPTKTKIVESANIVFSSYPGQQPGSLHAIDWTGAYTKGATTITLADASMLTAGQTIVLDQLNDTSVDMPGYTPIVSPVGNEGTCGIGVNDCISPDTGPSFCTDGTHAVPRALLQVVGVESVSGNTVTLDTPLYYTHLASLSPQAFFWDGPGLRYAGIEDLKIDAQYTDAAVSFTFCTDCWVKGVEVDHIARGAVTLYYDRHVEVRDSYFFMNQASAPENYGLEVDDTSASRFENNILDTLTAGILLSWSSNGNVVGYNYAVNADPGAQIIFADSGTHSVHTYMNLWESNVVTQLGFDVIWGSGSHETLFRNSINGYMPPRPLMGGLWSNYNWPLSLQAWQRFFNIVGNVLGTAGVQNGYEAANAPIATGVTSHTPTCQNPSCGLGVGPIYILGYWESNDTTNMMNYDPLVASTLFRWGNFDYFTTMTHWDPKEIPSGAAVPTTQTLPASLYLPSKPSWFGGAAFPAIGPDVTGMATPIPAELCYQSEKLGSGGSFDPATCY